MHHPGNNDSTSRDSADLGDHYRRYLDTLNRRAWDELDRYVAPDVVHNERRLGLSGYRHLLEDDVDAIPDLTFRIDLISIQPPLVAARLVFDCHPRGRFLGVDVNGRRARFSENVFYRFDGERRITRVWSVIDRSALSAGLE